MVASFSCPHANAQSWLLTKQAPFKRSLTVSAPTLTVVGRPCLFEAYALQVPQPMPALAQSLCSPLAAQHRNVKLDDVRIGRTP